MLAALFSRRRQPVYEMKLTLVRRRRDGALFGVHHPGFPAFGIYLYRVRAWRNRLVVNGRLVWRRGQWDPVDIDVLEEETVWATCLARPHNGRRVA